MRFALDDNAGGAESSVNELATLIDGKCYAEFLRSIPALILPIRHAGQKDRLVICARLVARALAQVSGKKLSSLITRELIEAFSAVLREYYYPQEAVASSELPCMEAYWPERPFDQSRWVRNCATARMSAGINRDGFRYMLHWSRDLCADSINQRCNIAVSWALWHIKAQDYRAAFETMSPWYDVVLTHREGQPTQPLTLNNRLEVVWLVGLLACALGKNWIAENASERLLGIPEWHEPHWKRGASFVEPTRGFFDRAYLRARRTHSRGAERLRTLRISHGRSPLTSDELEQMVDVIRRLAD